MNVNIKDLIERLERYKEKVQDTLSEEDDLLLAFLLAVLEGLKEE